ncbi:MAG: T9SS type A sorting domain-containing protein [Bacteroidota bacterium]
MKNQLLQFKIIVLGTILFTFSTSTLFSQAASATYALTANGNAAIVGNITAGAVSTGAGYRPGGISAMSYTANGVSSTNWISYSYTTFDINSSFYNQDYYQYSVSPTAGNNLTVTTISLQASASTSTPAWFVYYSLDNFATSFQLGAVSGTNFTGLNILVPDGSTLRVRVFGMDLVANTTAFRNKSVVISGTTAAACSTPAQPASIFGIATLCPGVTQNYSVVNNPSATSYTWTLPVGWSGSSTTNSISATTGASSGTITVTANNACGSSAVQTYSVTVNSVPAQPVAIIGASQVCPGSSQTFSVASDPAANNYTWTVPSGWSGFSSSNSITSTVGAMAGNITVTANNGCGSSTPQVLSPTIITTPAIPSAISGDMFLCDLETETYSVVNDPSATSYTWTLPNNWTGTSTSNSIEATNSANGGDVTVTASNSCGTSLPQTISTVFTTISNAVSVNGATLTADQAGATYQWVDCDNSNDPIFGETSQSFTPTSNGNYAVIIELNTCIETSSCTAVTTVNLDEIAFNNLVVSPNPSNGIFTIKMDQTFDDEKLVLLNFAGQTIENNVIFNGAEISINIAEQPNGIYFLRISNQTEVSTIKLIKQ